MKTFAILAALLLSSLAFAGDKAKTKKVEEKKVENKADASLNAFYEADPSFRAFLDKAYAYAVYPEVGKGAAGIGGAFGKGTVYEKGPMGFAVVGTSELKQGTIGIQLGGQVYSEIVVFENAASFAAFKKANLDFTSQASVVALKSGASANTSFKNGVAIFTVAPKGLMGELSVGGQHLSFEPKK